MTHTSEQYEALTRFIPIFKEDGFQFSESSEAIHNKDGSWTPPYTMLSDPALKFVRACYDNEWVVSSFSWPEFARTEEARRLRDDPAVLAQANEDQLAKLLTIIVRQERFSDGSLTAAFESGLILGILHRLNHLVGERHDG